MKTPVNILVIPAHERNRVSAYHGFLPSINNGTVKTAKYVDSLQEAMILIGHNRCPFDFVFLDLNFPTAFTNMHGAGYSFPLDEKFQIGHALAMMAARQNPNAHCVLCIENATDATHAAKLERNLFRHEYGGRIRHIDMARSMIHGTLDARKTMIIPGHHAENLPIFDWITAAELAFPFAKGLFARNAKEPAPV